MTILYLISLFLLFPLGEVTRYQFGNGTAVSLFDIAAVCNLLFVTVWSIRHKLSVSFALTKPILLFSGLCVVSLLVNLHWLSIPWAEVSALYILRFLAYASFYLTVILLSPKIKERLPFFFIIAGTLVGVFGIMQFFLYPNLRNLYYLGWDEHWYRLFATFFDPNFAGAVLLFPFFFSIFTAYQFLSNKQFLRTVVYALISLFFLVSIFLTFSRSALIALVCGLVVFFLTVKVPKWIPVGLFALLLAGIILISVNYKATEGTKLYRLNSSVSRIESVQTALTIFTKNPILGIGFNAYRYAQKTYGFATGPNWEVSHSGAGTDNSYLFVLATTGVLGFAAFSYMLFRIFIVAKNTVNRNKTPIAAALTAIAIASLFINALFYPAVMFLLWSGLGLIENTKQ